MITEEAAATGDTKTTTQYAVLCSEVLCKVNMSLFTHNPIVLSHSLMYNVVLYLRAKRLCELVIFTIMIA